VYPGLEIIIEPWKKLIIHEVIEYKFDDWLNQVIANSQTGSGIIQMNWANGIAFNAYVFPDTDPVVEDKLKGVLHYSSVTFAIKEKFERQIIKGSATINFADASVNEIFGKMVDILKGQSKYKHS